MTDRRPWTSEEDAQLKNALLTIGEDYRQIQQANPNLAHDRSSRTALRDRARVLNAVLPQKRKKEIVIHQRNIWTEHTDQILLDAYDKHKDKRYVWKAITDEYGKKGTGTLALYSNEAISRRVSTLKAAAIDTTPIDSKVVFTCICGTDRSWILLLSKGFASCCDASMHDILAHLETQISWVVYIVLSDKSATGSLSEDVDYVGFSGKASQRRKEHNHDFVRSATRDSLRISVFLGETECINLFRPLYNVQQTGNRDESWHCRFLSDSMATIDGRNQDGHLYGFNRFYKKHALPKSEIGIHLPSAGSIMTCVTRFFLLDESFCMVKDVIHCAHTPICAVRRILNDLSGRPVTFGIPSDCVRSNVRPLSTIVPQSFPVWEFPEWTETGLFRLLEATPLKKSTITGYKQKIDLWFRHDLASSIDQPWRFVSRLFERISAVGAERHITVVLCLLRNISPKVMSYLFGVVGRWLLEEYQAIYTTLLDNKAKNDQVRNTLLSRNCTSLEEVEAAVKQMELDFTESSYHLQIALWYKIQMYQPMVLPALYTLRIGTEIDKKRDNYIDIVEKRLVLNDPICVGESIDDRVIPLLDRLLADRHACKAAYLFLNKFGEPFATPASFTSFITAGGRNYLQRTVGLNEMRRAKKPIHKN